MQVKNNFLEFNNSLLKNLSTVLGENIVLSIAEDCPGIQYSLNKNSVVISGDAEMVALDLLQRFKKLSEPVAEFVFVKTLAQHPGVNFNPLPVISTKTLKISRLGNQNIEGREDQND